MLTMQNLIDSGHPHPTRRALAYANGYLKGMSDGASPYNRAKLRATARWLFRDPAYGAGWVRARLDCTAARFAR